MCSGHRGEGEVEVYGITGRLRMIHTLIVIKLALSVQLLLSGNFNLEQNILKMAAGGSFSGIIFKL